MDLQNPQNKDNAEIGFRSCFLDSDRLRIGFRSISNYRIRPGLNIPKTKKKKNTELNFKLLKKPNYKLKTNKTLSLSIYYYI